MSTTSMTYPLRLPASLKRAAEEFAEADGVSLNAFVTVAVAEKVSALTTERFFSERRGKADPARLLAMLNRKGTEAPRPGDELPEGFSRPGPAPAGFAEGKARYRRNPRAR